MAKENERKGVMDNLRGFLNDSYYREATGKVVTYRSQDIANLEKPETAIGEKEGAYGRPTRRLPI
jgi:hypothetical protein